MTKDKKPVINVFLPSESLRTEFKKLAADWGKSMTQRIIALIQWDIGYWQRTGTVADLDDLKVGNELATSTIDFYSLEFSPELIKRLESHCAEYQLGTAQVMQLALKDFLDKNTSALSSGETIATLVQTSYEKLKIDGKIKPENLEAIANGQKPSNSDLARIAFALDLDEQKLVVIRDRDFPVERRNCNGLHR